MQTFSVVWLAGVWTVVALGRQWGRFAFKVDAEEAALRLATRAEAKGDEVEVLVQERWGEMRHLPGS